MNNNIILNIRDRLDGDLILTICIKKKDEDRAIEIIQQAENDWYNDDDCILNSTYGNDIELMEDRLQAAKINFTEEERTFYA